MTRSQTMAYAASTSPPVHVLLNPFAWFLWALDFCLWLLLPPLLGPIKMIQYLMTPPGSKEESTGQRINSACAGGPVSIVPGEENIRTVHDLMQVGSAEAVCERVLRPAGPSVHKEDKEDGARSHWCHTRPSALWVTPLRLVRREANPHRHVELARPRCAARARLMCSAAQLQEVQRVQVLRHAQVPGRAHA